MWYVHGNNKVFRSVERKQSSAGLLIYHTIRLVDGGTCVKYIGLGGTMSWREVWISTKEEMQMYKMLYPHLDFSDVDIDGITQYD